MSIFFQHQMENFILHFEADIVASHRSQPKQPECKAAARERRIESG
jgi:hypothetical protein